MYYTKIALLTFGAGLVLGLAVVVIEIDWLDRVASGLMALGLMAIPLGMIVDWRLATKSARRPPQSTQAGRGLGPRLRSRAAIRGRANPPRRSQSDRIERWDGGSAVTVLGSRTEHAARWAASLMRRKTECRRTR